MYHEFSNPEQMLAAIRKSLKPAGRVALAEFRAEDPKVPIKPLHKMSKAQIMKEFPPNGFKLVEEFDKLPWQHLMFFQRDDAPNTARIRWRSDSRQRFLILTSNGGGQCAREFFGIVIQAARSAAH